MSATEVVANMPLHSATVRVNKHKADWRGWKFMWPFALVFVFVFVIPILYARIGVVGSLCGRSRWCSCSCS